MLALFYFPSKFPNTNKAHNINVFFIFQVNSQKENIFIKNFKKSVDKTQKIVYNKDVKTKEEKNMRPKRYPYSGKKKQPHEEIAELKKQIAVNKSMINHLERAIKKQR